jgi:small subunit ribosomal protein S15
MALEKTKKTELIKKFHTHETDTGSPDVQIALLSERINGLSSHFEAHVKDHASRRGLLQMVGRRRKLLNYLKKHDETRYKALITALGLRK